MNQEIFRSVAAAIALLAIGSACPAVAEAPLGATPQSNLGFGQFFASATPGTVTVSPTGVRTRSGGVALGNSSGVGAASFLVTGEPNTAYGITLPTSATLSAGGSSMTVDGFTSNVGDTGNLGPGGTQIVTLGATLIVGSGQASASYSCSYAVTFSYY